jgi:UDPglucose 6-dehydrogenase
MRPNVGIVGNGFVGSSIVSGFSLHANIMIYDKKPELSTHSLDEVVNLSDFIFVSVPTPMRNVRGGEIDLGIMNAAVSEINEVNRRNDNVIIIKSTVVPGTVEEYVESYPSLNIVFSPEFLTERNAKLDFINSARIILGGPDHLTDSVERMFRVRFPHTPIVKTDYATAQLIKYMANCFFAVKISFMNEMKQLADATGVNWEHAVRGFITDGRIGNSHIDVPGHDGSLGFGGKCFPKDINALIYKSKSVGVKPTVLEATWHKNLEVRQELDWAEIEGAVTEK